MHECELNRRRQLAVIGAEIFYFLNLLSCRAKKTGTDSAKPRWIFRPRSRHDSKVQEIKDLGSDDSQLPATVSAHIRA